MEESKNKIYSNFYIWKNESNVSNCGRLWYCIGTLHRRRNWKKHSKSTGYKIYFGYESNKTLDYFTNDCILACYSTDIIGSCAFGLNCNTFKDLDSPFRSITNKIFSKTIWETLTLIIAINFQDLGSKWIITKFKRNIIVHFFRNVAY